MHKISHFKIFSCIAKVNVPSQKMHKLDDNSMKCILWVTSLKTKWYQEVIFSCDVMFDEKNA